jgi:hypothetical protein
MTDVSYYEQGHHDGDWMHIAARVEQHKDTAIVHDVKDGRWEAWLDGHCVFGSAGSLSEAQQALSKAMGS